MWTRIPALARRPAATTKSGPCEPSPPTKPWDLMSLRGAHVFLGLTIGSRDIGRAVEFYASTAKNSHLFTGQARCLRKVVRHVR